MQKSSKLFPLFLLAGLILPVIAGFFLGITYMGFPNAPAPVVPYILLPLGLLAAAAGFRLSPERWEGGLLEVLHIRLSYASLAYLAEAAHYALRGRTIHRYPAGLLAVMCGLIGASRLLVKYRARFSSVLQK